MSVAGSWSWLFVLALSSSVYAEDFRLKDLVVEHPYARATPPGATTGGAFVAITNRGAVQDRLLEASTPAAKSVEIHEMSMDGGMMKMRAVRGIDIKPGARVELKPGGYHLMLLELKEPLQSGRKIPLTLVFERSGRIEMSVPIEDLMPGTMHPMH